MLVVGLIRKLGFFTLDLGSDRTLNQARSDLNSDRTLNGSVRARTWAKLFLRMREKYIENQIPTKKMDQNLKIKLF